MCLTVDISRYRQFQLLVMSRRLLHFAIFRLIFRTYRQFSCPISILSQILKKSQNISSHIGLPHKTSCYDQSSKQSFPLMLAVVLFDPAMICSTYNIHVYGRQLFHWQPVGGLSMCTLCFFLLLFIHNIYLYLKVG